MQETTKLVHVRRTGNIVFVALHANKGRLYRRLIPFANKMLQKSKIRYESALFLKHDQARAESENMYYFVAVYRVEMA